MAGYPSVPRYIALYFCDNLGSESEYEASARVGADRIETWPDRQQVSGISPKRSIIIVLAA